MIDIAMHPRILDVDSFLPRLREYFHRPEVVLAYLYGSYATGRTWIHSDVDIAVLLADSVLEKDYLDHRLRYISDVADLLEFEDVDLQILNEIPLELRYRVVRDGLVLFARSELERARFEARVIEEYLDFRPVLDLYYEHLCQRIREGKFSARLPRYIAQARAAVARPRATGSLPSAEP